MTATLEATDLVPSAAYTQNSYIFRTEVKVHDRVPGTTVVSHVLICNPDSSYHEVAVHDNRALDVRDHRWKVVASHLDRDAGALVFRAVWEAVEVGHRVYGVRWVDGRPEAVITRDCAFALGLVESR